MRRSVRNSYKQAAEKTINQLLLPENGVSNINCSCSSLLSQFFSTFYFFPSVYLGCLNWKNMDPVPKRPSPFVKAGMNSVQCTNQFDKGRFNETDNRGLAWIAKNLEKLYKTTDYPDDAPVLPEASLWATGKSRADLWQFAVNVALEVSVERANTACR